MGVPPETLIVVALVIFVGYTVFGATGFGASPITVPVLAHVLPLTFVLALAALLDVSSGLALGFHTRRQADTRELLTLVPFTLVGLALGVTLLVRLPRDATMLALGLFVCAYALHVMLRRAPPRRLSRWWAAPAGVLGGIVGALFGMGGPPYVVYISGRIPDPAAQRATISQMVILNVGLRVLAFALAGVLFAAFFVVEHHKERTNQDPLFELSHDPMTRPSGRYRLEKFEDDPAGAFDEATPSPEVTGIDRGGNERQR